MKSLGASFIAMVPKKEGMRDLGDFQSINKVLNIWIKVVISQVVFNA